MIQINIISGRMGYGRGGMMPNQMPPQDFGYGGRGGDYGRMYGGYGYGGPPPPPAPHGLCVCFFFFFFCCFFFFCFFLFFFKPQNLFFFCFVYALKEINIQMNKIYFLASFTNSIFFFFFFFFFLL